MPSGVVHDRITIWLLPWIAGITYYVTRSSELTLILSCGYLFSGLMFGPDLDIASVQYKRWGLIRGIWLPYRRFLRHRSVFSHGLILGTCGRLLYLLVIVFLTATFVVAIAQMCYGFAWNWQDFLYRQWNILIFQYPQEAIALLIGLEIGAMSHSISDWYNSYRQQRRKNQLKTQLTKAESKPKKLRSAKIYHKKK